MFGAAYEFVFNVAYQLKRHGLQKRVPLHYISAEPFAGHFGIGGLAGGQRMLEMFFKMTGIRGVFDVAMEEIAPGQLRLTDRRMFPFRYAMVVPPFSGPRPCRRRRDDPGTPEPSRQDRVRALLPLEGPPRIHAPA